MSKTIVDSIDDDEVINFFKVKTTLSNIISRKVLIEWIRSKVDESPELEFTSNRARKVINPDRPNLALNFNLEYCAENKIKEAFAKVNFNDAVNYRTNAVREAIIKPLAVILSDTMSYILDPSKKVKNIDIVNQLLDGQDLVDVKERLIGLVQDEATLKEFFTIGTFTSISFADYEGANIDEDPICNIEIML